MSIRSCEVCKTTFETKVGNQRFCGKECFVKHRKAYGEKNIESRKVTRTCRQCKKPYRRVYEKHGFCSISCGSKWNIEHGVSDAWKHSQVGKRSGRDTNCNECNRTIYIVEHQFDELLHFCDRKCKGRYFSKIYKGSGNPMFGKKLSQQSLEKQKRTLLQNHGVTNAYFLSKHRTVSKAQQEILNHLSSSVPFAKFEGEKLFHSGAHKYFVDVFSEQAKMIIEYNGDYWHCNPDKYEASFFHPKKLKTAEQIWAEDEKRMETLKKKGYHTITVWESEYGSDRQNVLKQLTLTALSCSKVHASG